MSSAVRKNAWPKYPVSSMETRQCFFAMYYSTDRTHLNLMQRRQQRSLQIVQRLCLHCVLLRVNSRFITLYHCKKFTWSNFDTLELPSNSEKVFPPTFPYILSLLPCHYCTIIFIVYSISQNWVNYYIFVC